MKFNSLKKVFSNFVTTLLFILLFIMLFMVISSKIKGGEPNIFGYELKIVLSGSMEPEIKTGSIIAVKPGGDMTRFKKGDVITFKTADNVIVTHRISKLINNGSQVSYRTKGDNNKTDDVNVVESSNIIAEYTGITIPYLGYFAEYSKSKMGSALLLLIPGLFILGYSGISIWKTFSEVENKKSLNNSENIEKIT